MKYKALLLDIDNTLYDYNFTHAIAKRNTIKFCIDKFNMKKDEIELAYKKAREKVHIELSETAASHNRLLYFQKMCENLETNPLQHSIDIYNVYWDTFLENIKPFEGIYDLLEKYKDKICLVTDLTAHIQYRKINTLKLSRYCSAIVTSEEAGREKPHPYMFLQALHKLNIKPNEACMIGDNYQKDIFGAANIGMDTIWLNHENKQEKKKQKNVMEAKVFKEILELV